MIRTYDKLNAEEKQRAFVLCLNELIMAIVDGVILFDDEHSEESVQKKIKMAIDKAEGNQTPWFASEYIMQDEFLKSMLEKMALDNAQEAIYPNPDVIVVDLFNEDE